MAADHLVVSSDPNFRPSDVKMGPDGAIYFSDWHNPIIGHMQHNLRDPNRNRTYGRVYRITYEGRPLSKSPKIDGANASTKLLDALKSPEDRVRYRARLELGSTQDGRRDRRDERMDRQARQERSGLRAQHARSACGSIRITTSPIAIC